MAVLKYVFGQNCLLKLAIFCPNMSSRPHKLDILAQPYSIPYIWMDITSSHYNYSHFEIHTPSINSLKMRAQV